MAFVAILLIPISLPRSWHSQSTKLHVCRISSTRSRPHVTAALQESLPSFRLMSYNIHGWRDSDHQCNYDRLVDVISQINPDVLCLNEVLHPFAPTTSPLTQEYYEMVRQGRGRTDPQASRIARRVFLPRQEADSFLHRLAKDASLPHSQFGLASEGGYFGDFPFGNAILSKHPIASARNFLIHVDSGDIDLGDQKRDAVESRGFLVARIILGSSSGAVLDVCSTHLDHKSEQLREKQIRRALLDLKKTDNEPSVPVVVCGDLNTFQRSDCDERVWQRIRDLYDEKGWSEPPEESLALNVLKNEFGFRDAFYEIAHGMKAVEVYPQPTCWTHQPVMRIDHVWLKNASEETLSLIPTSFRRLESDASDHFPIVVDFQVRI